MSRKVVPRKIAKAAEKAAKAARKASAAAGVPLRVIVDSADDTLAYYVNYAEVSFTAHEFMIAFVRVPTKLGIAKSEEIKDGSIKLDPIAQVLFPPTMMPGLIKALTSSSGKYEAKFGEIKELQNEPNE